MPPNILEKEGEKNDKGVILSLQLDGLFLFRAVYLFFWQSGGEETTSSILARICLSSRHFGELRGWPEVVGLFFVLTFSSV